jgi:two-component system, chemotaxis family, sensor kinase CheA
VFERAAQDREGFVAFVKEMTELVERLAGPDPREQEVLAAVHTVKGNAAQWGASSVAKVAHELEAQAVDRGLPPSREQREALALEWQSFVARFRSLAAGAAERVELTRVEVDQLVARVRARAPYEELAARLERCKHEPAALRLQRMADALASLADRLGKPRPHVSIEANDVRLPASRFAAFWAAAVHVLRNMMDHGIEPPEARAAAGKPAEGQIVLRAFATDESFVLELGDDGRGINWGALARRAREEGLPAGGRGDLERALFAPGVSTATDVTEISGRGVGLSAVLERCAALGGYVGVESVEGEGTRFVFTFPRVANEHSIAPEAPRVLVRVG